MTLYDELDELEKLNSTIDKEEQLVYILKKYKNAETFFRLAFNDDKYGIQEQTFYNTFDDVEIINFKFNHVSEMLQLLDFEPKADGLSYTILELIKFAEELKSKSGSTLLISIKNWFRQCDKPQKKWFSRAILKDLRCGVQVKTINKVFKRMGLKKIEKFSMQLCDKLDPYDAKDVAKKITFPCSMECKYDGIRIQAEIWESSATLSTHVTLTSRRGTDRTNDFPEICEALKEKFEGEHIILDGEIIADSFQKLTRKDDKSTRKYVIFDLLIDEKLHYISRWDNLYNLLLSKGITAEKLDKNIKYNNNLLATAEHYSCNNIKELQEYYEEVNRRQEEGLIVKLDYRPYERNSRKHMFKCKKVYSADLLCVGFKLGEGKRSGKVATLCLQDKSGKINVDVGSGIDDYTCEELTKLVYDNKEALTGKIVEILYNEKTETGSLRFPRFITIRDDKDEPDDLGV